MAMTYSVSSSPMHPTNLLDLEKYPYSEDLAIGGNHGDNKDNECVQ